GGGAALVQAHQLANHQGFRTRPRQRQGIALSDLCARRGFAGVALGDDRGATRHDRNDPSLRDQAEVISLHATLERWPLREVFAIARGSKREALVVVVEARRGAHRGWGEAVPYPRYGEDPESVLRAIERMN